jgi:hypothetical protein
LQAEEAVAVSDGDVVLVFEVLTEGDALLLLTGEDEAGPAKEAEALALGDGVTLMPLMTHVVVSEMSLRACTLPHDTLTLGTLKGSGAARSRWPEAALAVSAHSACTR